jgi:hypothetical protein
VNVDSDVTRTLVTFLTGGGLVTLLVTAARSYRTVRTGALSSTRAVVKDLVEARNEAEARQDVADRRAAFWQDVAMRYRRQLILAGVEPDPLDPKPPPMNPREARADRARRDRLPGRRRDAELEDTGDILG